MLVASSSDNSGISLMLIESGLTVISLGLAFALPKLGSSVFSQVEHAFMALARRRGLAVAAVGIAAFLMRLALFPFIPIPLPFVPDDFSFLLAADTFAHGRLANPTPPMWVHFETIHVSMQPMYMSMYFPAGGLVLAAGKVLFGCPWFAVLLVTALMCAAVCWMLQAWLPPGWALLGGILVILRIGLFSYWINSHSAASSLAALAGALVLGAAPRLTRKPRPLEAILLGVGMGLLAISRPYEGRVPRPLGDHRQQPPLPHTGCAARRAVCADLSGCGRLAGILRLSRISESSNAALLRQSRSIRHGPLLRVAAAASCAGLSPRCDATLLFV
jgi:hypothetical protein